LRALTYNEKHGGLDHCTARVCGTGVRVQAVEFAVLKKIRTYTLTRNTSMAV
jgi:hypothetical protein